MFLPSNMTLRPGDSGDFVAELQRRLASLDYLAEGQITTVYDAMTTSAVRTFQSRNGIHVDGVAGPETLRRLSGVFGGGTFTEEAAQGGSGSSGGQPENAVEYKQAQDMIKLMEQEKLVQEQKKLEQELQQHTGKQLDPLQQTQHQMQTQKQLPGVMLGVEQHMQMGQRAEIEMRMHDRQHAQELVQQKQAGLSETQQQAMQKEAFVDRPISQTLGELGKGREGQGGPEQGIEGHGRGPALGLGPEKAAAQARGPEQGQAVAGGISKPMEGQALGQQRQAMQQQHLGRELGREQAQGIAPGGGQQQGQQAQQGRAQGMHPDFERIRGQMEARLPAHVIQEVRQVGVVMVGAGMQQSRMPAAVEGPSATPEVAKTERAVGGSFGR
jgi:hypothetical protein